MYQNLLHDVVMQRIAERRREADVSRRWQAARKAPSAPAGSATDRARRRWLPGRRAATSQNC